MHVAALPPPAALLATFAKHKSGHRARGLVRSDATRRPADATRRPPFAQGDCGGDSRAVGKSPQACRAVSSDFALLHHCRWLFTRPVVAEGRAADPYKQM